MKYSLIINKIMFLDIETVSSESSFTKLSERMQELWVKKSLKFSKDYPDGVEPEVSFFEKAAIQAEFGKIICISTGLIEQEGVFTARSFASDDEHTLLKEFAEYINKFFDDDKSAYSKRICTHNGREFDIPYIIRRMIVNNILIPDIFNISGKKPWEIKFIIDTQELWQFGDYKYPTSLDLLACIFGIESPKDDINGSEVTKVYYQEGNLDRIKTYCEKDILTTARVYLALNQMNHALTTKQIPNGLF